MRIKEIKWDFDAWDDYLYWQTHNKQNLKRINQLVKDIRRSPFEGIGKPEPLKGNFLGGGADALMRNIGLFMQLKMKRF